MIRGVTLSLVALASVDPVVVQEAGAAAARSAPPKSPGVGGGAGDRRIVGKFYLFVAIDRTSKFAPST